MKILLAVDGSKHSLNTTKYVIKHAAELRQPPAIELVTVHLPLPKLPGMSAVVGKGQVDKYYQEEGEANLANAKKALDAAKLKYQAHVLVGPIAETLVKHAKNTGCDVIHMGTQGMSELGKALLGSVATRVAHLSDIPVLLIK